MIVDILGRGRAATLAATALAPARAAAVAPASTRPGSKGVGDRFFPKAGQRRLRRHPLRRSTLRLRPEDATASWPGPDTVDRRRGHPADGLSRFDLDYRGPKITDLRGRRAGRRRRRLQRAGPGADRRHRPTSWATASEFEVKVALRGKPQPGDRPGRLDRRAGCRPTTAPSWPASRRARRLVSLQRPPDRQGDLRASASRCRSGYTAVANGALDRDDPAERPAPGPSSGRGPADGDLSGDRDGRAGSTSSESTLARHPDYSTSAVDTSHRPATARSTGPRDHRLPRRHLRPLPVRPDRGDRRHAPQVGYALETQTRPIYDSPPERPRSWRTSWRTSGSATRSRSRTGRRSGSTRASRPGRSGGGTSTTAARTRRNGSTTSVPTPAGNDGFWNPPPASVPGPDDMFDDPIYDRGGMALQAAARADRRRRLLRDARGLGVPGPGRRVTTTQDFIDLDEGRHRRPGHATVEAFFDRLGLRRGQARRPARLNGHGRVHSPFTRAASGED